MKILIAPDKFKGSLTAFEVGFAIAIGIRQYNASFDIDIHPLADGGDGSAGILADHLQLKKVTRSVSGPLDKPVDAVYYHSDNAAFIEMATASGLVLLKSEERNPLQTTTLGTGQLIADAIAKGLKQIYLFLGGSATNDGGIGIAKELGFQFLDQGGKELAPIGVNLMNIHEIKHAANLEDVQIICLCDVENPLLGHDGASHVYAPQKGASVDDVVFLEKGMQNFARIVQLQTGTDITQIEGGGAAGGIAAGLHGLLNAEIQSGIGTILQLTNFEKKVAEADLIISGEGKLDQQTLSGKVIDGVSKLAAKYQKPLLLFVGQNTLTAEDLSQTNFQQVHQVMDIAQSVEEAMKQAGPILTKLSYQHFVAGTKTL